MIILLALGFILSLGCGIFFLILAVSDIQLSAGLILIFISVVIVGLIGVIHKLNKLLSKQNKDKPD